MTSKYFTRSTLAIQRNWREHCEKSVLSFDAILSKGSSKIAWTALKAPCIFKATLQRSQFVDSFTKMVQRCPNWEYIKKICLIVRQLPFKIHGSFSTCVKVSPCTCVLVKGAQVQLTFYKNSVDLSSFGHSPDHHLPLCVHAPNRVLVY